MSLPNLFDTEVPPEPGEPAGFQAGSVSLTELLGATQLIVKLAEIQPGNHLCPYHYEYVEEWMAVISGPVLVRTPEGTQELVSGDVMHFPIGPAGAHRVTAPAEATAPARVLMFSADADPAVVVYPDGDKLAVYNRGVPGDEVFLRRAEGSSHLDYYDGESA